MNLAAFLKQVIIAFTCSTSRSQPSSKPFLAKKVKILKPQKFNELN
jgi:hypothetical protein